MWITPVYDRTQTDVDNKTSKGYRNASDINRIENNIKEMAAALNLNLTTKSDWLNTDFLTQSDIDRIISNLTQIRNIRYTYSTTPQTPQTPLNTFWKLNNIEQIQNDIYAIYTINLDTEDKEGEYLGGDLGVI
jgi:hypothetical protein